MVFEPLYKPLCSRKNIVHFVQNHCTSELVCIVFVSLNFEILGETKITKMKIGDCLSHLSYSMCQSNDKRVHSSSLSVCIKYMSVLKFFFVGKSLY